LHLVDFLAS